jgi:hypothetical protein
VSLFLTAGALVFVLATRLQVARNQSDDSACGCGCAPPARPMAIDFMKF